MRTIYFREKNNLILVKNTKSRYFKMSINITKISKIF